jgi:hypothetical protein
MTRLESCRSVPDRGAAAERSPFAIRSDPYSRVNRVLPFLRNFVYTKTKNRAEVRIGPNFAGLRDETLTRKRRSFLECMRWVVGTALSDCR